MNKPDLPAINRRTAFVAAGAAGAVGALAAVATVVPATSANTTTSTAATAGHKPAASGGYQLTDHVKQYYATARV